MAELTCSRSGESSCDWYHSTWQYLRLLDLVSSPWWHASFYRDAIARQGTGQPAIRVLISDCTDFSTHALVQGQMADSAAITSLDRCPTPLIATSWYARRIGPPVPELLVADAAEHERPGCHDIIVSDSSLPRFPVHALMELLRTWCGSLAPGGAVLTTVQIHKTSPDSDGRKAERLQRWRQAATDAQSWWPEVSDLPLEQLVRRISGLVANQERHTSLDTSLCGFCSQMPSSTMRRFRFAAIETEVRPHRRIQRNGSAIRGGAAPPVPAAPCSDAKCGFSPRRSSLPGSGPPLRTPDRIRTRPPPGRPG